MSGISIISVSLMALDVFFLGTTSWIRRQGSPCAGCKQKQRELERFVVVYMCWVTIDSSLYLFALFGGLFLSILLHGFRSSREQSWTDNLHDKISQNRSILQTPQEFGGFIITYMEITCIDGTFILEISVINYWGDTIQLKSWREPSNTISAFKCL